MQLSLAWNGANVEGTSGIWTRRLYGGLELGTIEWPRNLIPVAGLGHSFLGVGQPSPRTVQFAVESYRSGAAPTDLEDSLVTEHQALATMYGPRLGEKALTFTRTPSGGSPVSRSLYCVAQRSHSWRIATDANQPGVRRGPQGRIVYPVQLQAAFPWFVQERTELVGNNTTVSGSASAGDMPCGWRLTITAGAGQGVSPKPAITMSIAGVTLDLTWADYTFWSNGWPGILPVPFDQDDVAVIEFYYAPGFERLGVVSYIREEGSTTNLRDFGVLVPSMAGLTAVPLIPAAGGTISATATGLAASSVLRLAHATLHETF